MGYDGSIVIETKIDTSDFDSQIDYVESEMREIEYKIKQADMGFEVGDALKLESQYEKLNLKLIKLQQRQAEINKNDFSSVSNSIDNIGNKTEKTIKKLGKWVLAVFGIRTAYSLVRKAMSNISTYNDQVKTDIDYINFAISSTMAPLIEKLISLSFTLLNYLNQIAMAWFGVNLFANASTEAFAEATKQAEDLQKTTAGFDEMNIVGSDSGSTSTVPSLDLSIPQGDTPGWLKFITENKDLIIETIIGIAGALTLLGLGFSFIISLGFGLILAGIYELVQGLVAFIADPSWENFSMILQGIAIILAGIAILTGSWIIALVALGVALVSYIIKNWDKIKEILGKVGTWIYDTVIKPIGNFFSGLWEGIIIGAKAVWSGIKSAFNSIISFFSTVFKKIKSIFKSIVTTIGNVISSAFKNVINGMLKAVESVLNTPIRLINSLIGVINKVPGISMGKLSTFNLPRLATGGIVNYPNTGVNIGGAIAGESGAEGVIPLTDSQAMETLGASIGKYITINATIENRMNSRVISKQLQTIKQNNDFLTNG